MSVYDPRATRTPRETAIEALQQAHAVGAIRTFRVEWATGHIEGWSTDEHISARAGTHPRTSEAQ